MPEATQISNAANPFPVPVKDASLTSRSEIAAQTNFSEIRYAQC